MAMTNKAARNRGGGLLEGTANFSTAIAEYMSEATPGSRKKQTAVSFTCHERGGKRITGKTTISRIKSVH